MITSTANDQVKYVSALQKQAGLRREDGLFVAEGLRLFGEIPCDRMVRVYVSEGFARSGGMEAVPDGVPVEAVSDRVFAAMSDTKTPQGVLALVRTFGHSMDDVLGIGHKHGAAPFLLLIEDIRDPGNLGTMFRSAEAAGATGIVMGRETVDVYSPKVIRSSMGSVFRMPFMAAGGMVESIVRIRELGVRVYALALGGRPVFGRRGPEEPGSDGSGRSSKDMGFVGSGSGPEEPGSGGSGRSSKDMGFVGSGRSSEELDFTAPVAFLVGNEANGLSPEAVAAADEALEIPMCGRVESLNAAMAATVLMYETLRQRMAGIGRHRT
ncbi:MAG: RNA methyltransferase [Lachnospiraceae bacterium]|jgi:TrmH family RNA methyltransferase|nr:RNA methyltransferase [Lachnospiraceae bacterium]